MLEPERYEVWRAHHGKEAVERLADGMPALILLDMRMPMMNQTPVRSVLSEMRAAA